jgi:hypothetical protein
LAKTFILRINVTNMPKSKKITKRENQVMKNVQLGITVKKLCINLVIFLLLSIFVLFWHCTENPVFRDDKISGNSIRGKVELSSNLNPGNVYVWLKVLNISTRTKMDGSFELKIPPPSKQSGGGIDGIYDLYFYVANYQLDSLKIPFSGGNVLYSEAIINQDGELKPTIKLSEILKITTSFNNRHVSEDGQDTIFVFFNVEAYSKPVVLSSFINQNSNMDPIFLVGFLLNENKQVIKKLCREDRRIRRTTWQIAKTSYTLPPIIIVFNSDTLEHGEYEVVPYMDIWSSRLPDGLFESFEIDKKRYYPEHLKIPLKIMNNKFKH